MNDKLYIPSKQSGSVSFVEPLSTYLTKHASENAKDFSQDLLLLENVKNQSLKVEPSDSYLNKLIKYYVYIQRVATVLPIDEYNIKLTFSWTTLFKEKSIASYDLNFEIANILFNIGSIKCQMGIKLQNSDTEDSIKQACNSFQEACSVFNLLETRYPSASPDLNYPTLKSLNLLTHAWAQTCYWKKAKKNNLKEAILSKLASQIAKYYSSSAEAACESNSFTPEWINNLKAQEYYFIAIANIHKSREDADKGSFGDEIARLYLSKNYLKKIFDLNLVSQEAIERAKSCKNTISDRRKKAEKDNDVIYIQPVPSVESLSEIPGVSMVNVPSFPNYADNAEFKNPPILANLAPAGFYSAMYNAKALKLKKIEEIKANLINVSDRIETFLKNEENAFPTKESTKVPVELFSKAQEVRQAGGVKGLTDIMDSVSSLHSKAMDKLRECSDLLDNEAREDEQMKNIFGPKWQRPSSRSLNKVHYDNISAYKDSLMIAAETNKNISKKIEEHYPGLLALSAPEEELILTFNESKQNIPEDTPSRNRVRELKDKILNVKSEIARLLIRLDDETNRNSDISFSGIESNNYDEVLNSTFEEVLSPLRSNANIYCNEANLTLDEGLAIIRQAQESQQSSNQVNLGHEHARRTLEGGYKGFKEITHLLQDGMKFYDQLLQVINEVESTIRSFSTARNIEKVEHARMLNSNAQGYAPPGTAMTSTQPPPPPPPSNAVYPPTTGGTNYWNPSIPIHYSYPPQHPPPPQPPGMYPTSYPVQPPLPPRH